MNIHNPRLIICLRFVIGSLFSAGIILLCAVTFYYLLIDGQQLEQAVVNCLFAAFGLLVLAFLGISSFLSKRMVLPISKEEYQLIQLRNLIHFSDQLSNEDIDKYRKSSQLHMIATNIDKMNYNKRLIWFHCSEEQDPYQPNFESFWLNHFSEATSRKYKVIIPLSTIPFERIYVRPYDKAIAIENDYVGTCEIQEKFPWYNHKVHLVQSIKTAHLSFIYVLILLLDLIKSIFTRFKRVL